MRDLESGLHDIAAIRSMMERASRFLTLSGLSGVSAGVVALAGAWAARATLNSSGAWWQPSAAPLPAAAAGQLVLLGAIVLALALAAALLFSARLARKQGRPLWGPATRHLIGALAFPLVAGGALSLILLWMGVLWLVPGIQLLFYGAALFAAGSVTFGEIRILGIAQAVLGLGAAAFPQYGLLLWAGGFGALHILYGGFHYARYER